MTDRIIAFLILCLMFSLPFGVAVIFTGEVMLNFVFFWPLFMSALWISGGVYFWFYRERHWKWGDDTPPPTLEGSPLVSILIPCFNEGINARETIEAALAQRYKNIEVIAINDGSTDDTHDVLEQLAVEYPSLRVIHLAENQGKALALKTGAAAARSDYLVCIDGDALLDRDAVAYIVAPLIQFPRVGAVTGNPRIRTRSTLIGRVQVGERGGDSRGGRQHEHDALDRGGIDGELLRERREFRGLDGTEGEPHLVEQWAIQHPGNIDRNEGGRVAGDGGQRLRNLPCLDRGRVRQRHEGADGGEPRAGHANSGGVFRRA